ncbi:MAG: excalibur calcium-binding domain-containing protein, partial [Sulfurovum sp.]|nr:excalibur calcium-binding domain-containing protein [Sulfurovaceae bacterium]
LLSGEVTSAIYFTEPYKSKIFKENFPSIAEQLNPQEIKSITIKEIIIENRMIEQILPKEEKIILECTGKTICNEMRSCGEALYYISTCPNIDNLDKDNNGIPCEEHLCGDSGLEVDNVSVNAPVVKNMYTPSNDLKCDGRQYCSQMTSCEEASYFLRNCPNTKMDRDANGIPCERQWCKK